MIYDSCDFNLSKHLHILLKNCSDFSADCANYKQLSIEKALINVEDGLKKNYRVSRSDVYALLQSIDTKQNLNSNQSLTAIKYFGTLFVDELPEIRMKLAQNLWNNIRKFNIPIDIAHYNALLTVYNQNECDYSPDVFLNEIDMKGITPNQYELPVL